MSNGTTNAAVTITPVIISEILAGDWSSIDAVVLAEILTAITDAGNNPADYDGLEDRVNEGPTIWEGRCTVDGDGTSMDALDACDESEAVAACKTWLRDGDWRPESEVTGEISPEGWDAKTTDVSIEIPAEDAPEGKLDGGEKCEDHDWTSDGCGGLEENPGVWSTGGTAMIFKSRCRKCGMGRTKNTVGSQHNSGKHDTTTYEADAYSPDSDD